jgi:UDP-N-acetylglucosamine--N-acetylmuramyl-(pentapeptide) pyrophosphoryl-undecaprenol N-acetylglucosamine transferase
LDILEMKTLLVASEGGHLAQLYRISEHMLLSGECVWVTFDTPQSRSLLAGEEVYFAPFAGTRDLIGTAKAALWACGFLRTNHFDTVISTGASIAIAVLPLASLSGADCYYVESATRANGPSLTGRLLTAFPSIQLRTQHERWSNHRWLYRASVFDDFRSFTVPQVSQIKRIVVSFGMHKGFSFRRPLERLVKSIPEGVDVLWQVGDTDTSGLNIDSFRSLPASDLTQAMTESDIVITHAGMGSVISALTTGKRPIIVPRRKQFKEHIDDHQVAIAAELENRGLAFCVEADEIEWDQVVTAASWRVEQNREARPFVFR